jgi:hypothetical protein
MYFIRLIVYLVRRSPGGRRWRGRQQIKDFVRKRFCAPLIGCLIPYFVVLSIEGINEVTLITNLSLY